MTVDLLKDDWMTDDCAKERNLAYFPEKKTIF